MRLPAALLICVLVGSGFAQEAGFSIPLYHVRDDRGNLRFGVYAALGGSTTAKLYELDTGSSGTYAAYNPDWWPQLKVVQASPGPQDYGSGVQFDADIVQTTVSFQLRDGTLSPPATVQIGKINSASAPGMTPRQWATTVAQGQPPLHGVFFGNFGSGLKEKNGMFAVLAQIPGAANGFIIRSGGVVEQIANGTVVQRGEVIVGLTPELRATFPMQVPMRPQLRGDGTAVTLPSGFSAREEYPLDVTLTFSAGDGEPYSASAVAGLDTGGVNIHIHEGSFGGGTLEVPRRFFRGREEHLKPGTQMQVTTSGEWNWGIAAGDLKSVNRVQVSPKSKSGAAGVNLGIASFFDFDVMFDLENGQVGFRPITTRNSGEEVGDREVDQHFNREREHRDRRRPERDRE